MSTAHERRLSALEAAAGQGSAGCRQLLSLAAAGRLTTGEMVHLSDQQLWWIVAGECSPTPADEAELERILTEVINGQSSTAAEGA